MVIRQRESETHNNNKESLRNKIPGIKHSYLFLILNYGMLKNL